MNIIPSFPKQAIKGLLLGVFFAGANSLVAQNTAPTPVPITKPVISTKNIISLDLVDALTLNDPNDLSQGIYYSVRVPLYADLLNVLAHFKDIDPTYDDANVYNDTLATYITRGVDAAGYNHYTAVPGAENIILGYSKLTDKTKLAAALCPNQSGNYALNGDEVDSDGQSYIFINLGSTYTTPTKEGFSNAHSYYYWQDAASTDYYWVDYQQTVDKKNPALTDDTFSGAIFACLTDVTPTNTNVWYVDGNKKDGITEYKFVKPVAPATTPASATAAAASTAAVSPLMMVPPVPTVPPGLTSHFPTESAPTAPTGPTPPTAPTDPGATPPAGPTPPTAPTDPGATPPTGPTPPTAPTDPGATPPTDPGTADPTQDPGTTDPDPTPSPAPAPQVGSAWDILMSGTSQIASAWDLYNLLWNGLPSSQPTNNQQPPASGNDQQSSQPVSAQQPAASGTDPSGSAQQPAPSGTDPSGNAQQSPQSVVTPMSPWAIHSIDQKAALPQ